MKTYCRIIKEPLIEVENKDARFCSLDPKCPALGLTTFLGKRYYGCHLMGDDRQLATDIPMPIRSILDMEPQPLRSEACLATNAEYRSNQLEWGEIK
jgi:hypothetical protein